MASLDASGWKLAQLVQNTINHPVNAMLFLGSTCHHISVCYIEVGKTETVAVNGSFLHHIDHSSNTCYGPGKNLTFESSHDKGVRKSRTNKIKFI